MSQIEGASYENEPTIVYPTNRERRRVVAKFVLAAGFIIGLGVVVATEGCGVMDKLGPSPPSEEENECMREVNRQTPNEFSPEAVREWERCFE